MALRNATILTEKFNQLSNEPKLKINHAKSKFIPFNKIKENSMHLEINHKTITNVHHTKYLGILLPRSQFSAKIRFGRAGSEFAVLFFVPTNLVEGF